MKHMFYRAMIVVLTFVSSFLLAHLYDVNYIKSELVDAKVNYLYDNDYDYVETANILGYRYLFEPDPLRQEGHERDIEDKRYFFYQDYQLKVHHQSPMEQGRTIFPYHTFDLPSETTFIRGNKPARNGIEIALGYDLCVFMRENGGLMDLNLSSIEDIVGRQLKMLRVVVHDDDYKILEYTVTVSGIYKVEGKAAPITKDEFHVADYSLTTSRYWYSSVEQRTNLFNESFCYPWYCVNPVIVSYKKPDRKSELKKEMADDVILHSAIENLYYPPMGQQSKRYSSVPRMVYQVIYLVTSLLTVVLLTAFVFGLLYQEKTYEIVDVSFLKKEWLIFALGVIAMVLTPCLMRLYMPWLSLVVPIVFGLLLLIGIYSLSIAIHSIIIKSRS
jgi:hypothetical protein